LKFTRSDYLQAIRSARYFTEEEIQKSVVSAYCKKVHGSTNIYSCLGDVGIKEEYKKILQELGYNIVRYPARESPSQTAIITFKTIFEPQNVVDKTGVNLVARTKSILKQSGFGSVFYKVILSDDLTDAVEKYFPNTSPDEVIAWGNMIQHARKLPAYPQGILFPYKVDKEKPGRVPCLILSPSSPPAMTVELLAALRMRIVHECTHFYWERTCFSDDKEAAGIEVLETCGYMMADVIRYLLEESFAHADTAGFNPTVYFKSMEALTRPLEVEGDFRRDESKIYCEINQFITYFPVVFACAVHEKIKLGRSIFTQWTEELQTLGEELLSPVGEMYYRAALLPRQMNKVKEIFLAPKRIVLFYTWKRLDELFYAKWREWDL